MRDERYTDPGYEDPDKLDGGEGGEELYEHFTVTVDKGQSLLRLDKFLVHRMEHCSRNRIQAAADSGSILVNDTPAKASYKVKPLDRISIVMPYPRRDTEIVPQELPLDILYEDDDVILVNKAAGMVVHPGHGNWEGTLVHALAWHLRDVPMFQEGSERAGLVHRIDKDTSGLLVVAKTPDAKTDLGRQFFNKTTRREYVAVVWGRPEPADGRIEGNIGRSLRDRLQMAVFPDGDQGKHAVTHYHTVEPLGHVSVVKCVLETGRTHQIRVHMRHIGHPLFNDARYGGDQVLRGIPSAAYKAFVHGCMEICPRQALHARTLGFRHPETGEEMDFSAPVPHDMQALIERWRAYAEQAEKKIGQK